MSDQVGAVTTTWPVPAGCRTGPSGRAAATRRMPSTSSRARTAVVGSLIAADSARSPMSVRMRSA